MRHSRWKFVALWQATGMACVVGGTIVLFFVLAAFDSRSWAERVAFLPEMLIFLVASLVAVAPVSIGMLWGWAAAVRRLPALERSVVRTIIVLAGYAVLLALLAGGLSSWEAVWYSPDRSTFAKETLAVARRVLPWAVVGLVLPRVLIPSLRPRGVASPPA